MRIQLDTRKTIEQNAAAYFERAKRAKRKVEGAKKAVRLAQEKLQALAEKEERETQDTKRSQDLAERKANEVKRKQEWYEKLRWFLSSDGLLCIGGRDATTNELVVKKHAQQGDVVFHTDMAGSPFVIVKAEGRPVPQLTLEEAAQFCACFSRAWKNGFSYLEVFYVAPDQLSKEPNPGEFLPKGAFMVRGSVKYLKPRIEICIGKLPDGRMMAAAETAVLKHCGGGWMVLQGNEKSSDVAKRLAKEFSCQTDDIIPLLPPGGVKLGKELRKR